MNYRLWFRRWGRARPIGWVVLIALGGLWLSLLPIVDRVRAQPNAQPAPTQAAATATPFSNPTATPPTQGGNGQNLFFIYCMPCHGDQGQGLTDEFRNRQYPPEDTNCWKSGCHGERPYENGFKLPKVVPAIIGTGTLSKFNTAQDVYAFIHSAMPFNKPGSLTDTQYLQLLAFLLERNQIVSPGVQLQPATLAAITLHDPPPAETTANDSTSNSSLLVGLIIFAGVATLLSIVTRPRRNRD